MIVFPKEAMKIIKHAHYACLTLSVAILIAAGIMVYDSRVERSNFFDALTIAEKKVKSLDKDLGMKEQHIQYLEREINRWHRKSWAVRADDPKLQGKTASNWQ